VVINGIWSIGGKMRREKPKFLEVNPSKGHFVHHKSHMSCSGT
jgi:hypothetical protein